MTKKKAKKVINIFTYPTDEPELDVSYEVSKVWGSEFHIHNDNLYCTKAMVVFSGGKCSIHMHREKTETFVLCAGELIIETINLTNGLTSIHHLKSVGDSITINPETPHTFYVPKNQIGPSWFVESSTEDFKDDSYRLTQSTGPTSDNR
jgi:mannose-6-phosphate isomerase-like protein (cupin superfamily)